MKTLLAVLCLLAGSSLLLAETPAGSATPVAPAKPAAPAAKKSKAKPAEAPKPEEPKIPGTVITRSNGTFLGLEVVGGNFKLSFYDAKKKPMAPDVTRASARWPNPRASGDSRCILNPSGNALIGNKPALPPYTYNVYLTLLQGEGEEAKAVESHVIPYRQ